VVFSEALQKRRPCRNPAGESGYCRLHPEGKVAERAAERIRVRAPRDDAPRELVLARDVIRELRAFLRDPSARGRLVNALGEYEDHVGITSPPPREA
jgi:hypothetical protein